MLVETGEVAPGDTVIVMGIGGIGAMAVQAAAALGAARVIAVDPVAFERESAQRLDLCTAGKLQLDELITNENGLDDINRGYADMHAGKNLRGVIRY